MKLGSRESLRTSDMFIAPRLHHALLRSEGGTDSPPVDHGVSAPPNEAGSGKGLRAINMLPLWGKESCQFPNNLIEFLRRCSEVRQRKALTPTPGNRFQV